MLGTTVCTLTSLAHDSYSKKGRVGHTCHTRGWFAISDADCELAYLSGLLGSGL